MECNIEWNGPEGMLFVATTGSGHTVAMDGAPEGGGNNLAPRPMEMMLVSAGGCSAYDIVLILKRGRHQVTRCQVTVQASGPRPIPRFSPKSISFSPSPARTCLKKRWNGPSACLTKNTVLPLPCWKSRQPLPTLM